MRGGRVFAGCIGLLALLLSPGAGLAQLEPSEVELEDVIEVDLVGRDLLAYDLLSTSTLSIRLDIDETLVWKRASGRIGLAMTDRRVLAATPRSSRWQQARYGIHEVPPERGFIGKRVALLVTSRRILGFDGGAGIWIQQELGPNETALAAKVGASTAVVVTDRTAYGLSPDSGGFFSIAMQLQEELGEVRVTSNMGTVSTSKRLLIFRAPAGVWTEEEFPLH